MLRPVILYLRNAVSGSLGPTVRARFSTALTARNLDLNGMTVLVAPERLTLGATRRETKTDVSYGAGDVEQTVMRPYVGSYI